MFQNKIYQKISDTLMWPVQERLVKNFIGQYNATTATRRLRWVDLVYSEIPYLVFGRYHRTNLTLSLTLFVKILSLNFSKFLILEKQLSCCIVLFFIITQLQHKIQNNVVNLQGELYITLLVFSVTLVKKCLHKLRTEE